MNRELTPEEKRLNERQFIAKQEVATKRRKFAQYMFVFGLAAGLVAAALRGFHFSTFLTLLFGIIWIGCLIGYLGAGLLPGSFSKDMDLRWHLNPWQEALSTLTEGRTQTEGIALLAGPLVARVVFSFLYLALK